MAERYSSFDRRGWRWFLQRVTAAVLVVVLVPFRDRSLRQRAGLNWPPDADRLPNGNTLITDTMRTGLSPPE